MADLRRADLRNANLTGADLTYAKLGDMFFGNTNLSNTQGLETCSHFAPNILDPGTINLSGGLPDAFLRGCGYTAWEIEAAKLYRRGLTQEQITTIGYNIISLQADDPIQLYSCFISYSGEDEAFTRKLYDRMQNAGIRTWFAREDMRWGKPIFEQLDHAIQRFDKLLLVLTEASMKSGWVEHELRTAIDLQAKDKRRRLFPIRLVDFEAIQKWRIKNLNTGRDLADEVRSLYIPDDFTKWEDGAAFERAFDKLRENLVREDNAANEP